MNRISSLLLVLLLVFPVFVDAKPKVNTLEVKVDGSKINYSGTMEDGSYAVMCKLYSEDTELDMLSSEVSENKFEGDFTVAKNGTYMVYCANYEGGDIKSAEAVVSDASNNPKTGDNILLYASVLLGSALVVTATGTVLVKRKLKRN